MGFASWLENDEYERLLADFRSREQSFVANPAVAAELAERGAVSAKTLRAAFNLPEGEANFVARELNKEYGDRSRLVRTMFPEMPPDPYVYHVTLQGNLANILRQGLVPGKPSLMTNYAYHSAGKIFLCDRGGIPFWKEKVENHAFHNTGEVPRLIVLRVLKSVIPDLQDDPLGSQDSRHPAYSCSRAIPASAIELAPAS